MNTDHKQQEPNLHGASNTGLLLKEATHAIIGCGFEVLNEVSPLYGDSRNCSQPAKEFRGSPFFQCPVFPVAHFHQFGFRVSDFRLRRPVSIRG